MTDYIERRPLFDALYDAEAITAKGINIFRNFPAADVQPVVRGKWEQVDDYRYPWGCTNCRKTFSGRYNFCPNCGADMRETNDEEA